MKIIFMGTPKLSAGILEALLSEGQEILLAVTQPDKPKGRGKGMQASPVKETALAHGIPVYQPVKIRASECINELQKYKADVIVVVAFGQILPGSILKMAPYGCVNVHASLLPKYRGAAPIQWAVINGEKISGVTTMQMDEGIDTGDILLKKEVVLDENETGGSLYDKMTRAGAELCVKTLKALEAGELTPVRQGESPTAYARMLDKSMGNIDWGDTAEHIERLIRGLDPWPSAYTDWEGKVMKIWHARVCPDNTQEAPGTIVKVEKDGFLVQTGDGLLKITELQIPGKKRMEAGAFLRGYALKTGEILKKC